MIAADGDRLQRWTAPIFPGLDAARSRLHRATCWLSDIAWAEHPDYRAGHAFARSLTMPVAQLAHAERVFIAAALHARYGGAADDPAKALTRTLLDDAAAAEARALGLALRLAYTLSGGALELLDQVPLARERDRHRPRIAADRQLVRRRGGAAPARCAGPRAGPFGARAVRRRSPSPALA